MAGSKRDRRSTEGMPKAGKRKKAEPTWEIHKQCLAKLKPRPSNDPFLNISWTDYMEVLEWAMARLQHKESSLPLPRYFQQKGLDPEKFWQAFEQLDEQFNGLQGPGRASS